MASVSFHCGFSAVFYLVNFRTTIVHHYSRNNPLVNNRAENEVSNDGDLDIDDEGCGTIQGYNCLDTSFFYISDGFHLPFLSEYDKPEVVVSWTARIIIIMACFGVHYYYCNGCCYCGTIIENMSTLCY